MDDQGIWVTLSEMEWQFGVVLGFERHQRAVPDRRPDRHGLTKDADGLGLHINGACGEIAVAKWRDCYFLPTIDKFKSPDIGNKVQVKTRSRHDYDLLVRTDDKDAEIFVLVTGWAPVLCLRGWAWGHEARQPAFLQTYGGREEAWFMPQALLRRLPLKPRPSIAEVAA
jgi:hypothetical protein